MVARSAVEGASSEGKLSGRAHKVVREMHGRVLWGTEQVLGDQPAIGQKFTERKEQPQKKHKKNRLDNFQPVFVRVRPRGTFFKTSIHCQYFK